ERIIQPQGGIGLMVDVGDVAARAPAHAEHAFADVVAPVRAKPPEAILDEGAARVNGRVAQHIDRQADEDAPAAQITRDVVAIERARGVIAGRAAVNPVATRAYDIVHVGSADPDLSRSMIGDDLKLPE